MSDTYTCPVCGYTGLHEPARLPSGGGSYEICWSCGFEYGVSDDLEGYSYEQWRKRWVAAGMPWSSAGIRPAPSDWNPSRQLANLLASSD